MQTPAECWFNCKGILSTPCLEQENKIGPGWPLMVAELGYARAAFGDSQGARQTLRELDALANEDTSIPSDCSDLLQPRRTRHRIRLPGEGIYNAFEHDALAEGGAAARLDADRFQVHRLTSKAWPFWLRSTLNR